MEKKRVGIITYHFARNYGAVLQCYALQRYLEKIGVFAEVIDARSSRQEKNNSLFHKKEGIKNILTNICLLPFIKKRIEKEHRFSEFVSNYIVTTQRVSNSDQLKDLVNKGQYDVVISGSDQVWNPHIADFDEMFFFPFETKNIKMGYSVSIGEASYDDVKQYHNYIKDFAYIGVRERGAKQVIERLWGHNVRDTVDPVLLLDKADWDRFLKKSKSPKKRYLLCYLIDKKPIKQNMAIAEKIAKKLELEIIYIWMHLDIQSFDKNFVNNAGPEEFLNYIYNASAVMTDGYHGTIFATIFNKEVFCIINNKESTDSRIKDYLSLLGLNDRIIDGNSEEIIFDKTDYAVVNERLKALPIDSKKFLLEVLNSRT